MQAMRSNGEHSDSLSFQRLDNRAIRARRCAASATLESVSAEAGLEPDEWRRLERGAVRVSPEVAARVEAALARVELMAPAQTAPETAPQAEGKPEDEQEKPERRGTCTANTSRGTPCRNWAQPPSTRCRQHQLGAGSAPAARNSRRCAETARRTGERCGQPAKLGSDRCRHHQGQKGAEPEAKSDLEQRVAQLEQLLVGTTRHQLEVEGAMASFDALLSKALQATAQLQDTQVLRINALESKVASIESAIETIAAAAEAKIKTPNTGIVERALGLAETDGTDVLEALADLLRVVKDREGGAT